MTYVFVPIAYWRGTEKDSIEGVGSTLFGLGNEVVYHWLTLFFF